jgi:hypothetical protein
MSWLERSRAHIVTGTSSSRDSASAEVQDPPKSESVTTLPSTPSTEPKARTVTESPERVGDGSPTADADLLRYLPTITPGRAGRYSVTDETGEQVGVIYGDYVIGFTVSCWSLHSRFADMDAVLTALAHEARARAAAGLANAS